MRIFHIKVNEIYYIKTYDIEQHGYPKLKSNYLQKEHDISYFKKTLLHKSWTMTINLKGEFVPDKRLAAWYFDGHFAMGRLSTTFGKGNEDAHSIFADPYHNTSVSMRTLHSANATKSLRILLLTDVQLPRS